MTGDEWKVGTQYEDPEDRAKRELAAAAHDAARALRSLAESMQAVAIGAAKARAVHRLRSLGVPIDEAHAKVNECTLIAAAEGRSITNALGGLVQRERDDHSPTSM